MVEHAYLGSKTKEERAVIFDKLLSYDIPCLIICRDFSPEDTLMESARRYNVPVLGTDRGTSEFMSELIFELNNELAPCTTIHGVLVDVYGEGLLITGESGIGKSEAALELIREDIVSWRMMWLRFAESNEHTLMGSSPTITKHLIELRGIGIIDVKSLYGVECVKDNQEIDFVIKLEDWHEGSGIRPTWS